MANTIITKNSSTASAVPTSGDLVQGELAVNVTDKRLFTEDAGGTVVEIGVNPTSITTGNLTATGTITIPDNAISGDKVEGGTINAITVNNLTSGTVDINGGAIDGTAIGASSASTGSFTTLAASGAVTLSGGTANGVTYLNGSKVLTSGSALTFDGTNLTVNGGAVNLNFSGTNYATAAIVGLDYYFTTANGATLITNAANGVQIWRSAGSEKMRLTSTGLGIGTSSPTAKLDILVGGDQRLLFTTVGTDTQIAAVNAANSSYKALNLIGSDIILRPNGTERLRLDTSGNLGLGVTPSAWGSIYVAKQIGSTGSIHARSGGVELVGLSSNVFRTNSTENYLSTNPATLYQQLAGVHQWYTAPSGTAGNAISFTQAMTLDASGRLGIGTTTTTAARLTSVGTPTLSAFSASIDNDPNSSSVAVITAGANTNGGVWGGGGTGLRIIDKTSNSGSAQSGTGLYISAPYDGTNASGGTYALTKYGIYIDDIYSYYGNNALSNASNWGIYAKGGAQNYFAGNLLVARTTDTDLAVGTTISNAGWIRATQTSTKSVFTLLNSTGALIEFRYATTFAAAVGTISTNGTTTAYNTSSDYRLKNITGPITTSGAYIDSLNPVEGTWKADGSTFVGLIAHEVQEASRTQVATGVKDGEEMQGMDYSSAEIIANLIAEVKALRTRVAALESI